MFLCEKWERNPAQGEPHERSVEPEGFKHIPYLNQVLPMFTKAIGDGVEGDVNWDEHVPVNDQLTMAHPFCNQSLP